MIQRSDEVVVNLKENFLQFDRPAFAGGNVACVRLNSS